MIKLPGKGMGTQKERENREERKYRKRESIARQLFKKAWDRLDRKSVV